jgi:hypothetical protein
MLFATAVQDALTRFQLHQLGDARPKRQLVPMLLAHIEKLFDHADWTYETKWYRKTGAA